MQDKKQIIGLILSVVLSVGLVVVGVNAATTVGTDVSVAGDLAVTATTTLNGDVVLGNAAGDNIAITGTVSAATGITASSVTSTVLSIGSGQQISKHLSGTASLNFGAIAAQECATASMAITGAAAGNTVSVGVPYAFVIEHDAITWSGYATTNVAVVKICNPSVAATPDFAAGTFRVDVWQH